MLAMARGSWREIRSEPAFGLWLKRLILIDIVLFALAISLIVLVDWGQMEPTHPDLLLSGDTTVTERFNHLKWLTVMVAMLLIYRRTRLIIYLALMLFYGLILLDDAGRLHERGGAKLAPFVREFGDMGIGAHQTGELLVWIALGVLIIPVLVLAVLRTPRRVWPEILPLGFAFVGLALAAVVVDSGHDLLARQMKSAGYEMPFFLWLFLVTVENFGEAVFASLTVAIAIVLAIRHKPKPVLAIS